MSRRSEQTTSSAPAPPDPVSPKRPNISSGRESVESFVFVFLFFLVLGVEAEGFVIPTGSMAPTLMGRHKEVTCPDCGYVYTVNADREVNESAPTRPSARWVDAGTCVNCRFQAKIDDEPNFQGDRIYVMKTPLDIPFLPWLGTAKLGRWEIAVFKLPEEPEIRYIKRLVGMPNEILRILRGDIWTRPLSGEEPFHRELRPMMHQDAMQMMVYDDSHRPRSLATDPRWKRWVPASGDWDEPTEGTFRLSEKAVYKNDWSELRYRHVVPDPDQWAAIVEKQTLPYPPRKSLITDFYSYNTDLTAEALVHPMSTSKAWKQPHWVGDLTLSFRLTVKEPKGRVRFELVKAGVPGRVEVDLSSGVASLFHGEKPVGTPSKTAINASGTYDVVVSNVDDRLTLRVNGALPFGDGVSYGELGDSVAPTELDLDPASVGSSQAAIEVSGLVLKRDIYYTLDPAHSDFESVELESPLPNNPRDLFDWLGNPEKFAAFGKLQPHDYPIAPGRYMMLGDNSPWSRDGRAWSRLDQSSTDGWDNSGRESWEVPESLLIGKAFCVYWPHLQPFGPTIRLGRDLRLPARPAIEKMRWIR